MATRLLLLLALASLPLAAQPATPPNLLPDPGFEADGGWELDLRADGQGSFAADTAVVRGGQRSIKLVKTNAVGAVVLRSAAPVHIEPNVRYTWRGWFHADDAALSNLLLFRITPEPDGRLSYNAIDRSAGWMSQSLLINAPEGRWVKRVGHYQAAEAQDVWLHVVLYGNPATVWLDDFEFTAGDPPIQPLRPELAMPYTAEQALEIVRQRPEATAQVVSRGGRSTLLVEGQPAAPVLLKNATNAANWDYHGFGEAGVNLQVVSVKLGGVRGERGFWLGQGQYDFSVLDDELTVALRKNPQARIVIDFWIYPYLAWGDEHPDEVWTNEQGQKAYGWWGNLEGFTDDLAKVDTPQRKHWWYPSHHSLKWRQDAGEALTAAIGHLRESGLGRAVLGFFISGGHDGQFQVLHFGDHSPAAQQAFRAWLAERYRTPEALAAAWQTPVTPFDQVTTPPTGDPAGTRETGQPYVEPGPELDFRAFESEQAWRLKDGFAGVEKAAAGKPVFTVSYGDPPDYDFGLFVRLEHLDATGSMSYYPFRNPGYATGFRPEDTFNLNGKLFFQELDLRSWVGSIYADEVYQTWIGAGLNPEDWRNIHRKLVGVSLAHQQGFWYYDMNHFFADPAILSEIKAVRQVAQRLSDEPPPAWRPDVCVVRTGGKERWVRAHYNAVRAAEDFQDMALETSGVPFDVHYLQDILARPELQAYQVYVFYQNRYLTTAERQAIEAKLKGGGRTLVWLHDTGYLSEQGKSLEAMSQLVGMTLGTEEGHARLTPLVDVDHPLTRGVLPFCGLSELQMTIMNLAGASSFTARPQPFWVADPAATPLGHFAETGQVALATRDLGTWRSVYVAAPNGLPGDLLNNLAASAGAYVAGPAGPALHMNGRFVSLHGLKTQDWTFRLPAGTQRVEDAFTGEPVGQGARVKLPLRAMETRWLLLR